MTSTPEPGTYTKGDRVKVAATASDAVALVFDGFSRVDTESAPEAEVADEPVAQKPKPFTPSPLDF